MFCSPFNSTLVDVPRPHLDPIATLQEALAVVALTARHPLISESVLLHLDRNWCGVALSRVAHPRTIIFRDFHRALAHEVVARCAATTDTTRAFIVTFRPGSPMAPGDVDALLHIEAALGSAGYSLADWVVTGRGGFYCPRVLIDAPDPWDRR